MFTTDIIHFLQQFDSPIIYGFMQFISALGLIPLLLLLVLGLTFGFDFRKGMVLLNILAWTSIATVYLKETINYPRPYEIDLNIETSKARDAARDLSALAPTRFSECFSDELLSITQNDAYENQGFPSGHTSTQVALWISIMILFRKKWTYALGIPIILLTLISRMYLGMHFLGDLIGGALLGIAIAMLVLRYVKNAKFYTKRTHNFKSLSFLGLPLLLLPFVPFLNPTILGSIIGINAAAILQIQLMNVPVNNGFALQRILTALIGVSIYLLGFYLPKILGISVQGYLGLLISFAFNFISFYGALALCRRINLIRN